MKKKHLYLACLQRATRSILLLLILLDTHVHGAGLVPSAMETIDDIEECLQETSLLFKGKHETSASTSSYFQDEFPQFLSVVDHHFKYKLQLFDGMVGDFEYPSSDGSDVAYVPNYFTQKCRNIGGMAQTHDLSIKCKWKNNVEELIMDFPNSPICISRKCNALLLRKQLSIELARQVQQYLNQQINSEIGTCRVTSDVCVRETGLTQNVVFGYREERKNQHPLGLQVTDLYGTLSMCKDINKDGYCFAPNYENNAIECEQKGGQLIMHTLQINYTGDLDSTMGFRQSDNRHSFTVMNYPHCISRICEVGRDAEDIEKIFSDSLVHSVRAVTDNFMKFAKLSFSLKILNDMIDYNSEPNLDEDDDDETRSPLNREESNIQSSIAPTHRQEGSTWNSAMTFLAGVVSTAFAILAYLNLNFIKAVFRRYHSPEVVPPSCEMV